MSSLDMNAVVGARDIALITLDTLRFDVADQLMRDGRTPVLGALVPNSRWQLRHAPASFTYASHQAFFAGFLPTPAQGQSEERLFALRFEGSATTGPRTRVFDAPDVVSGLRGAGYHTLCIGGVGFFNKLNPLGRVLPGLFDESYWSPELGVSEPRSTENQVRLACDLLSRHSREQRVFLFLNVSALHQPNHFYLAGASGDTLETHAAALEYVDRSLDPLFAALRRRGPAFCIVCSDHGTAYGEDGYHGHRLGHASVWNVPYAEFCLGGGQ